MPAGFNTTEKLLKVGDVAKILNVSQTTMRRIINSGNIGFFKFRGNIRFTARDVENYTVNNRIEPVA